MSQFVGKDVFSVGEYWDPNVQNLQSYLDKSGGSTHLFDVPLHYNFHMASKSGNNYNLRTIFDNTLVKASPRFAVTFVSNHDSQALQSLESVVEPWFKPLAYALIFLRREGYPCVFYTDYYGAEYTDTGRDGNKHSISMPSHKILIDRFLYARKIGTFGEQRDYFDHDNTIGWTFSGDDQHPTAMAVLMTNGSDGTKAMDTGKPNTKFVNIDKKEEDDVITDEKGFAEFHCHKGSVSVWLSN
jgi:alpha-amylase